MCLTYLVLVYVSTIKWFPCKMFFVNYIFRITCYLPCKLQKFQVYRSKMTSLSWLLVWITYKSDNRYNFDFACYEQYCYGRYSEHNIYKQKEVERDGQLHTNNKNRIKERCSVFGFRVVYGIDLFSDFSILIKYFISKNGSLKSKFFICYQDAIPS